MVLKRQEVRVEHERVADEENVRGELWQQPLPDRALENQQQVDQQYEPDDAPACALSSWHDSAPPSAGRKQFGDRRAAARRTGQDRTIGQGVSPLRSPSAASLSLFSAVAFCDRRRQ